MSHPTGNAPKPFAGSRGNAPSKQGGKSPVPGGATGGGLSGFFDDISFDEVETFAELPEGWYHATIASIVPGFTSNGNPQLEIQYLISEGQTGAGRKFRYWLVKTPKTAWKVKQFLESLSFPEDEMSGVTADQMMNRPSLVKIGYDPNRNSTYQNILDFRAVEEDAADASY